MQEIDLRNCDLNLLVVLEVLMAERNVTRAAQRLRRTQSAVSHSLARLRDQLGDPLLIKAGRRMQPTPFAVDFIERMRPILRSIQRALAQRDAFDPATSRRVFRLAAPDFALTLFTTLLTAVRGSAPSIAIEWTAPRETMPLDIAEGVTDLAIAPSGLGLPDGVAKQEIGALTWRCFARRGHPAFADWNRAAWSRFPHLAVRVGDQLESPVNIAAAAARLEREVGCWVPNFLALAPVLSASDLLATVPALVMADSLDRYPVDSRIVPFPIEPLPHALLWSAARASDPELGWLRAMLVPILSRVFGDT